MVGLQQQATDLMEQDVSAIMNSLREKGLGPGF